MSTRAGTGQDGGAVDLARVEEQLLGRWPETRLQPSLARISALVDLLGSPHRAYPVVHVAGTNGKTTTARMVDELLRGFGLRVGRFTSPHLQSLRERIVLDGEPVSAARFVETYSDIAPYVQMVDAGGEHPMSFFEVMVGLAYALFAEAPVDVAVVEQQLRLQGLGGEYEEVSLPLFGAHQAQNAATALAAVEAFLGAGAATGPIDQETVRAAFAAVRSPGRLERVRTSPTVLVDAAHNPAGMAATVAAIRESFDFTRLGGGGGGGHGKDVEGMLRELEGICAELVVTQNSSPRAMPADELGALAVDVFGADRVSVSPLLPEALTEAVELAEAGPDDPLRGSGVLVTGSVVTAGEARTLLAGSGS